MKKTKDKHPIQESQEVSPFPAGDHKAANNKQDSMTNNHETQIAKRIKLLEGLNMFDGTSINLISDVDQDK